MYIYVIDLSRMVSIMETKSTTIMTFDARTEIVQGD